MADEADVRLALATLVQSVIYPTGPSNPSAVPGFAGKIWIYPDWPAPGTIEAKVPLSASPSIGDVVVAAFDLPDAVDTTRFPVQDQGSTTSPITLGWSVSGSIATVTGTVSIPQNIGLVLLGQSFLYSVQSGDTLSTIASAIAALVNPVTPASAPGAAISIPAGGAIQGRVGGIAATMREVGRQKQTFQVQIWAPNEAIRQAVAKTIKPFLDDQRRIVLADGSVAMMPAGQAMTLQDILKVGVSCSAIRYRIEYATIVASSTAQVLTIAQTIAETADLTGNPQVGPTISRAF